MSNRLINITPKKAYSIMQMSTDYSLGTLLSNVTLTLSNSQTFITGDDLADYLSEYTRQMFLSSAENNPAADFVAVLQNYWKIRQPDYSKMSEAVNKSYNPIENYKMSENGIDGKKVGDTEDKNVRSGKSTTTETPSGSSTITTAKTGGTTVVETPEGKEKITTTPSGSFAETETEAGGKKTTATESRTTFDNTENYKPAIQTVTDEVPNSGNEKKTDHTFTNYKTEEETSYTQRKTTTDTTYKTGTQETETESFTGRKTETETEYTALTDTRTISPDNTLSGSVTAGSVTNAHEVDEHHFERSGNIGVTTSQQMIESEIALRYWNNLKMIFIAEFIRKYTF